MFFNSFLSHTESEKELKKIEPVVNKAESYAEKYHSLTINQLAEETKELKKRAQTGESLDNMLPEAYGIAMAADAAILHMSPFHCQVQGAVVLHQGKIAEMKTGEGKSNPVSTKIPTPDGWKTCGDIRVGDYLFDRTGAPTRVDGVFYQGSIPVNTLYLSDGRSVQCGDEHRWTVQEKGTRSWVTVTTQELYNALNSGKRFFIPDSGAVVYKKQEPTSIDPYLYGISFADGGGNNDYITDEYKYADITERVSLIRGLMDANGNVITDTEGTKLVCDTKNHRLAIDITEVMRSLGINCSINPNKSGWRITVRKSGDIMQNFFKNPVKKEKARRLGVKQELYRNGYTEITSIEKEDFSEEQVCFTVDNSEHLFLVGDFIVTHNTLVETMPAFLNALTGNGVHIVTVNDYLAKRDGEKMGKVFRALGMTVGIIQHDMALEDRKKAYACDITYVTNDELGFDYLRDNTASFKSQIVQRGLCYALIDEADSVLIDEARTPLILSGKSNGKEQLYLKCNAFALSLEKGGHMRNMKTKDRIFGDLHTELGDFETDEKEQNIALTAEGIKKAEKYFGIENIASPENLEIYHGINNALRAVYLLKKDKDYMVKNGEVLLVDEFTGRVLSGRRYSDGLQQAIEAKENVKIKEENITLASITFQSFFNLYKKKCGMTGTAMTDKEELMDIYDLDVVSIPTNKPVARKDMPDVVYRTHQEKLDRILYETEISHENGQPVLIGTASVESSEEISKLLDNAGISHSLLNAKNDEKEAEIIAGAGKAGAVTVATNMAGRGTDILLDEKAKMAGGLKVIGTERHESRRIDDQLRGRAGRQGDPGISIFLLSLDDPLIKRFAANKLDGLYHTVGRTEHEPLKGRAVAKIVEYAQHNVEQTNYSSRKNTAKYDRIINTQRQAVYARRRDILYGKNIHEDILKMAKGISGLIVEDFQEVLTEEKRNELSKLFELDLGAHINIEDIHNKKDIPDMIAKRYETLYRTTEIGTDAAEELERLCLLKAIDIHWTEGAEAEEMIKDCAWQDSVVQKNPEIEFGLKSGNVFSDIDNAIKQDTIKMLFLTLQGNGNGITQMLLENGFLQSA